MNLFLGKTVVWVAMPPVTLPGYATVSQTPDIAWKTLKIMNYACYLKMHLNVQFHAVLFVWKIFMPFKLVLLLKNKR